MIVELKQHPEILRVIRAVDPKYRKHKAIVSTAETVELSGTYWDGGSRSSYTAVDLKTLHSKACEQWAPPQFGGPQWAPVVGLLPGAVIVKTGMFCGKQATASVYVHPLNMAKLLP